MLWFRISPASWIHCVGMRSDREGEHPYCSNFCCMASITDAQGNVIETLKN